MNYPEDLAWIILLAPLLAAVVITLFTQRNGRLSAQLSLCAIGISFVISVLVFFLFRETELVNPTPFNWLTIGSQFKAEWGLRLDALSLVMLLIVTGVGGAIHVYSYGYMRDDRGFSRYFAGLSLFSFSMLGIVLANNFLMMFICWELVGLSSYLLIGFWYERPAAADACKKAFITNRLGDFGFMVGILIVWATLGSLNFQELQSTLTAKQTATGHHTLGALSSIAGLLIFCGAMGKSAQFPLHVWLPDAMEGPTPVSALIHAATMVAAGVYMLCRVFFLYTVPPAWPDSLAFLQGVSALDVIAWVGGMTALLAALIAVQQNDIKRILAYSTLSQLGYMVMAVGLSGETKNPSPAMFHLTTHAFFKALLFLGAGSVIHALHHEQDIWKMGGLKEKLPTTYWTFLVGTLALCGVPPFSGFYSKDSILALAAQQNIALFILGVIVAALTTFYMFRLVFVAFLGAAKGEAPNHAHEPPGVMVWPLRILAVASVLAGFFGIDQFIGQIFPVTERIHALPWHEQFLAPFNHSPLAAWFGLFSVMIGFSAAYQLYSRAAKDPLPEMLGGLSRAMRNRFYFDELYEATVIKLNELIAALADWFDRWIIAGFGVRGLHGTTEVFGRALRLVQTGNLQTYAFLFVLGVAVVLWFVLGK